MSTDRDDLIGQLQATRQAAVNASEALVPIKAQALIPPMDEEIVDACSAAMTENEKIIAKCDAAIVDAIIARPGFDAFLAKLRARTQSMEAETAALDALVDDLKVLKQVAGAVGKILDFVL